MTPAHTLYAVAYGFAVWPIAGPVGALSIVMLALRGN